MGIWIANLLIFICLILLGILVAVSADITLTDILEFADSPFAVGFVGTCLGALAGATAAHKIAERSKLAQQFDFLEGQIRAARIELIAMSDAVILRQQEFFYPCANEYNLKQKTLLEAWINRENLTSIVPELNESLQKWFPFFTPINSLEFRLGTHLAEEGKSLYHFSELKYCVENLNSSIERRTAYLKEIGDLISSGNKELGYKRLFGVLRNDGNQDDMYPSLMQNIILLSERIVFLCEVMLNSLSVYKADLDWARVHGNKIETRIIYYKDLKFTDEESKKYPMVASILLSSIGKLP